MSGMKKENVWIRGSYRQEGPGEENSEVCCQLSQLLTKAVCGGGTGASVTATVRAVEVGGPCVLTTSSSDEGRGNVCRKSIVELILGLVPAIPEAKAGGL